MRKILILMACAVWLSLIATNAGATALTFFDQYYVGQIIDGIPSNPTNEAAYISYLITLAPGTGNTQLPTPPPDTGEIYNRIGSTLNISFPAVPTLQQDDTDPYTVPTNYSGYILGKYDASNPGAGSYVWYVGTPGDWVVPTKSPSIPDVTNGYGLSHVTYSTTAVPEPSTMLLLGSGVIGLVVLRRKFKA